MKWSRQSVLSLLLFLQLALICLIVGEWLFVSTHRLYLEDRTDDASQGTAWEHFVAENGFIVPKIITRDDARFTFHLDLYTSSVLHVRATPDGPAACEVYLVKNGARTLLLQASLSGPFSASALVPSGPVDVEIVNHGVITWSDLRVVTRFRVLPELLAFAILFLFTCRFKRDTPLPAAPIQFALALASICVTFVLIELGMRTVNEKLPFSVADSRHDLGVFRLDPRWQFSTRYKKRMRPNSNTYTQWNYGDLVTTAAIPAEASSPTVNRFPISTDSEGFRNPVTRERIAVAALGDSFTDGLIVPREQTWPAQLEKILGTPVQNYGTAGFGPQQERYVLEDFAIHHHPKVVVIAFFAGNDIFDAESFAKFQQSPTDSAEIPGWKIKKVVMRYQTFYPYTLSSMALQGVWRRDVQTADQTLQPAPAAAAASLPDSASQPRAYFNRGMFHFPVHGQEMSVAIMPAYLRTLNYSREWFAARPGWELTRRTYLEIKQTAAQNGATLVVMFIPFKSQVFLPLLQRAFSSGDLNRDFRFYFRENQSDANVAVMAKNRLAQNELMRTFCEDNGLPFLDLTPAIQQQIEQGNNLYFPDDAHWNAAGHAFAAQELAAFLKQHKIEYSLP